MKKLLSLILSLSLLCSAGLYSFAYSEKSIKSSELISCKTSLVQPFTNSASSFTAFKYSVNSGKSVFSESFNYCCRNFLSDIEKQIYDVIVNSDFGTLHMTLSCNIPYSDFVDISFKNISAAIGYDHPELFYFEGFDYVFIWEGDDNDYFEDGETVTDLLFYINGSSKYTSQTIPVIKKEIEDTLEPYRTVFDNCGSRIELLRAFYDYIYENAEYDYDYLDLYNSDRTKLDYSEYNIQGCIVNNKCLCQGYAETFKYLCDLYHIPCLTPVSSNHMWNAVELEDGKWYVVDVTWDDEQETNKYFLKSPDDICEGTKFSDNHKLLNGDIITNMNLPYATVADSAKEYIDTRFSKMKNVTEFTSENILIRSVSDIGDDVYYNGLYREVDGSLGFTAPSGEDHAYEDWKYVFLGDANLNETLELQDYSLIVNNSLDDNTESRLHFLANDMDMDGTIDVIDSTLCELALNNGKYIYVKITQN